MSAELPHAVHARAAIIPYGNCVEEDADLFERLDHGEHSDLELQVGQLACTSHCPQFEICKENTHIVATALYDQTGEAGHFVAGEVVNTKLGNTRQLVTVPAVGFDISRLPAEPRSALRFLRHAVRAEKLITGPRTPGIVYHTAEDFIGLTAEKDPELHEWLLSPGSIHPDRMLKGLCDITSLLFMQADYSRVVKGIKYEKRYKPGRIDMDQHYDITHAYVQDVRTLEARGFKWPTRQALAFSPEEYQAIVDHYSTEINQSDLHLILKNNLLNPEKALRERLARLRILREEHHGTGVPDSMLRERARWQLPEGEVPQVTPKYAPQKMPAAQVRAIFTEAEESGYALAPGERGTVKEVVFELHRAFGRDDNFPSAPVIGQLAYLPLDIAIERCKTLMTRTKEIMERAQAEDVAPSYAHHFAERLTGKPASELTDAYQTHLAAGRLRTRASKYRTAASPSIWTIRRLSALYETEDAINAAADSMYALTSDKLLTTGIAELDSLQLYNHRAQLKAICDPKNGRYITFAPALRSLSPEDRLALASHAGLGKLLYGEDIDEDAIEALMGISNLHEYVASDLLPRCRELCADAANKGMPTSMLRLNADLDVLEWNKPSTPEQDSQGTDDIVTIIGGSAIQLGESSITIGGSEDVSGWLKKVIFQRCKPQHLVMAPAIEGAILDGILVITGDSPENFKVYFDDHLIETCDEHELAALSHVLGIDTFMYGADTKEILEARTGVSPESIARALMPRVKKAQEEIQAMATSEPEVVQPAPPTPTPRQATQEQQKTIHRLELALSVISKNVAPNCTPDQLRRFQHMLAYHIGRLRNAPHAANHIDKLVFTHGMAEMSRSYNEYKNSRKSKPSREVSNAVEMLVGSIGHEPVPLIALLRQQSNHKNTDALRRIHTKVYYELIGLGNYMAAKRAEK